MVAVEDQTMTSLYFLAFCSCGVSLGLWCPQDYHTSAFYEVGVHVLLCFCTLVVGENLPAWLGLGQSPSLAFCCLCLLC